MRIYLHRGEVIRQFATKVSLLMHICDHVKCTQVPRSPKTRQTHKIKNYKVTKERDVHDCNARAVIKHLKYVIYRCETQARFSRLLGQSSSTNRDKLRAAVDRFDLLS